ncbi:MAG: hypothetical protein HQK98_10560 [Nitrospirae bacterium]|nr:hypothetical protein [Nitrospirota bacterium]
MSGLGSLVTLDAGSEGVLRHALRLSAIVIVICLIASFLSAPVNLTFNTGKPVVCSLNVCHFSGFQISNNADIFFIYEPLFEFAALGYIKYLCVINALFRLNSIPVVPDYPPEN